MGAGRKKKKGRNKLGFAAASTASDPSQSHGPAPRVTAQAAARPTCQPVPRATCQPAPKPTSQPAAPPRQVTYQPASKPAVQPAAVNRQVTCQPAANRQVTCQPAANRQVTCQPARKPTSQPAAVNRQVTCQPASKSTCQPAPKAACQPAAGPSDQTAAGSARARSPSPERPAAAAEAKPTAWRAFSPKPNERLPPRFGGRHTFRYARPPFGVGSGRGLPPGGSRGARPARSGGCFMGGRSGLDSRRPITAPLASRRAGVVQRSAAVSAGAPRPQRAAETAPAAAAATARAQSSDESCWDDDTPPPSERPSRTDTRQNGSWRPLQSGAQGDGAPAKDANATGDKTKPKKQPEDTEEWDAAAGDRSRSEDRTEDSEPVDGDAGREERSVRTSEDQETSEDSPSSQEQERSPPTSESSGPASEDSADSRESHSSVETITVTVKYSSVPSAVPAAAPTPSPLPETKPVSDSETEPDPEPEPQTEPDPEPVDENANWLPLSSSVGTDGDTWFQQVVSDTLRERLASTGEPTPPAHTSLRASAACFTPGSPVPPAPRTLFASKDKARRVSSDRGKRGAKEPKRKSPPARTLFRPDPRDAEMAGVFFQSQEDLTQMADDYDPVSSGTLSASPGSIPLPPGSPHTVVPGYPRPPGSGGGGGGRLPGGGPVPEVQPRALALAMRQRQPETPSRRGDGGVGAPPAEDGIEWPAAFSSDGGGGGPGGSGSWWGTPPHQPPPPPPPPPQPPPPGTESPPVPGVPGRPVRPRDTTLDEVLRPRPPPAVDWWDGGPLQRAATDDVTLGEVERSGGTSAPVPPYVPGTSGIVWSQPHHHYRYDSEGRAYPVISPPMPVGRGAWRPASPPPGTAGSVTPRASVWPGRGLTRSEPRPGDDGFRPRYIPPEERMAGIGGGRRSLGAPPASAAPVDKCGPEAIAAFRRRMSRGYGSSSSSVAYDPDALLTTRLPFGFIDSHTHLDFLFKREQMFASGKRVGSLSEYRHRVAGATFPVSFAGCIAVFCDPNYWNRRADWCRILDEPGVWAAFGCHPHSVRDFSMAAEEILTRILKTHKSVVALGEIGLDYSHNNNTCHELQKTVFRRQLALGVSLDMPLVLHVRDAEEDALEIAMEMVPRDHLIHRHCVTGNWPMVRRWMEAFPNCYVGLTPIITNPTAAPARFIVGEVPLNRLLLETDAPFFVPHCYKREEFEMRFSHPGLALHVAAQVAAMRGLSLEDVVRTTAHNTRVMYRLPPQQAEVFHTFSAD